MSESMSASPRKCKAKARSQSLASTRNSYGARSVLAARAHITLVATDTSEKHQCERSTAEVADLLGQCEGLDKQ